MKRLAVLPLLLGLSQEAEAKPLPNVKTPEHYVVHDSRTMYKDFCSEAIERGEESAPLEECIVRRLDEIKFQPSTPMMEEIGAKYKIDPRLEQPSKDLVKEQSRVMKETLQKLKSSLGEKVTFISDPVMIFGQYRPEVAPWGDLNKDDEIKNTEWNLPEERQPETKAPYKGMLAYIALNQGLTPEESQALLHEEACDANGWCLRVAAQLGMWSLLSEGGRFAGFTGDVKLLEEKAPWGIKLEFVKKEKE